MAVRTRVGNTTAIRGPALTYTGDAFAEGLERTMRYEPDAIVAMAGGRIARVPSNINRLWVSLRRR